MHVISASRRTDIPAFHAPWFLNRVRAGRVSVVSPFGQRVFQVSLRGQDVIAIIFWTKNAGPMLPHLSELQEIGYPVSFLYTVNNYPAYLEPRVPDLAHTMRVIEQLSALLPPPAIRWRYDTIVITSTMDAKWHIGNFTTLCRELAPFTKECIFSFCDYYRKTVRNMQRLVPDHVQPSEQDSAELAEEMGSVARGFGIDLQSCAHDFLVSGNVGKARCIDRSVLYQLADTDARRRAVDALPLAPSRKQCGCVASRDVGAYDTCLHGCVYCYANSDPDRAVRNAALIDPTGESLHPRCHGPVAQRPEECRRGSSA